MKFANHNLNILLRSVILLFIGLWSFSSCTKKQAPSVILIAADRLAFNSFSCSEDNEVSDSGFAVLCQESIRYTNAYTSSTYAAAAMGSLLSGSYPFQNGLHRSTGRIKPEFRLASEDFKSLGYKTSFFSANANIMRRTGLARGFDYFDDWSFLNYPSYTVPFSDQINHFKEWLEESEARPFFTVIYNSDLETLRVDDNHLARMEDFDENLFAFIQFLKMKNLWDSNYIILTGLQGRSEYGRLNESPVSNLHSENINISFFIKPPRIKGDEGVSLKIDFASSLVDFGRSLRTLITQQTSGVTTGEFGTLDYTPLWSSNKLESIGDPAARAGRTLVAESVNPWSSELETRYSLLFGNFLYIEKEENELYNRLNDGLESIDIKKNNPDLLLQFEGQLTRIRDTEKVKKWTGDTTRAKKYVEVSHSYWSNNSNREKIFEDEKKRLSKENSTGPISTLLIYYLDAKKEKDAEYEEARRVTYNLAFENIWGLWQEDKKWSKP